MKKIVRLTESDLIRLVRRVIKEQEMDMEPEMHNERFGGRRQHILIEKKSAEEVSDLLNGLPNDVEFLGIIDCEFADFSDIDICGFTELKFLNIKNTENNFDEQEFEDCAHPQKYSEGFYTFWNGY